MEPVLSHTLSSLLAREGHLLHASSLPIPVERTQESHSLFTAEWAGLEPPLLPSLYLICVYGEYFKRKCSENLKTSMNVIPSSISSCDLLFISVCIWYVFAKDLAMYTLAFVN